jgi:hypothetical protein
MDVLNRVPGTMALMVVVGWCLAYYVCTPN